MPTSRGADMGPTREGDSVSDRHRLENTLEVLGANWHLGSAKKNPRRPRPASDRSRLITPSDSQSIAPLWRPLAVSQKEGHGATQRDAHSQAM
jgi:hypothetical protein